MRAMLATWCVVMAVSRVWGGGLPAIQAVFVIVLENHNWSDVKGNTNAPYLNQILLPLAAYCEQYYNPPGLHPSLPNYLWLEAGTNFGIYDDNPPAVNHQNTRAHLTALLDCAGITWKAYAEDISGTGVPLVGTNSYTPRHNPFVYFDDVTGTNTPGCAWGIAHIRPYSELASDLTNNTVARYNFIIPNVCDDGHDACPPWYNPILWSDAWLSNEVPKILASAAYRNAGALFVLWDEGASGSDGPLGLLLLSPAGRCGGYPSGVHRTHSSFLRTLQEIFGVSPFLGDAANATDLGDLFVSYGFRRVLRQNDGRVELTAMGVTPGRTNVILAAPDLADWAPIGTNCAVSDSFIYVDNCTTNLGCRFYRLQQLP